MFSCVVPSSGGLRHPDRLAPTKIISTLWSELNSTRLTFAKFLNSSSRKKGILGIRIKKNISGILCLLVSHAKYKPSTEKVVSRKSRANFSRSQPVLLKRRVGITYKIQIFHKYHWNTVLLLWTFSGLNFSVSGFWWNTAIKWEIRPIIN